MVLLRGFVLVILLQFVIGQVAHSKGSDNPFYIRPQLPKQALKLSIFEQKTDYSCGAAALLSVLRYWKVYFGSEKALYPILGTTPKDGTNPGGLVRGAQHFGLQAEFKTELRLSDLELAIAEGQTVILDLQAWPDNYDQPWIDRWEDGHYVVLMALDETYLYAMDPSTGGAYTYLSKAEFLERWHDYEIENGKRVQYFHEGIFIHGDKQPESELDTQKILRLR